MKRKVSILLAVVMILGTMLMGCGAKNESKYVGTTWTLDSVEAQGITIEGDTLKNAMPDSTIKFEEKKVTLNFGDTKGDGTWTEKDDTITIKSDGETLECPIKDSKLLVEAAGSKMYFVQQEEE